MTDQALPRAVAVVLFCFFIVSSEAWARPLLPEVELTQLGQVAHWDDGVQMGELMQTQPTTITIYLPIISKFPQPPPVIHPTQATWLGNQGAASLNPLAIMLSEGVTQTIDGIPLGGASPIDDPIIPLGWEDRGNYDFEGSGGWVWYEASLDNSRNAPGGDGGAAKLWHHGSYVSHEFIPGPSWRGDVYISVWVYAPNGGSIQPAIFQNGKYCFPSDGTIELSPGWNTPSTHNLEKTCNIDVTKPLSYFHYNSGNTQIWVDAARFEPWIVPINSTGQGSIKSCGWQFANDDWGCVNRDWTYVFGVDGDQYSGGNYMVQGLNATGEVGALDDPEPYWVCPIYWEYYAAGAVGVAFEVTINGQTRLFRTGPLPQLSIPEWNSWDLVQPSANAVYPIWINAKAAELALYSVVLDWTQKDTWSLTGIHQSGDNLLAQQLSGNAWYSKNHAESAGVLAAANTLSFNGTLETKGNPRANGGIEIFAKVPFACNSGSGNCTGIAVGFVTSSYVNFVAWEIPVYNIANGLPQGAKRLSDSMPSWYYLPSEIGPISMANSAIKCAWTFSATIGHAAQTPLKVGSGGYARWTEMRLKYGFTVPVAILYVN